MPINPGLDWLIPVDNAEGALLFHGRCLSHIRDLLITPYTQTPGLVLFLGRRRKDAALRYIYRDNQKAKNVRNIQLRLANGTAFSEHPILVADCDPQVQPSTVAPENSGHEEIPLYAVRGKSYCIMDFVLVRLLFLFVDVVCIFAEDLGGLSDVCITLEGWVALGRHATSLEHKPRVLVVTEAETMSVTHSILEENDFLFRAARSPSISEVFASLNLLHLHGKGRLSELARHRPLKDEIQKALDMTRRHRKEEGCLFSAAHLDGLFELALRHSSHVANSPFDFVKAAHWTNANIGDHTFYLREFLELTSARPWDSQAAFIASTLLLEAYPPSTHHFSPELVFNSLFRESCQKALESVGMAPSQSQHILVQLSRFHTALSLGRGPSRRIHEENLGNLRDMMKNMRSVQTCLVCLLRAPQHVLPCGHAYCDTCAARCGRPEQGAEYKYLISRCILCEQLCKVLVRVLPPTAGIRAITIDGGGVRGFIPLRFLEHFQLLLGPEFPMHELVDVAIGTSSGGFAVLKIFKQVQPVQVCQQIFSQLTTRFFETQPHPRSTWGKLVRLLRCWWTDSWYDTSTWDKLLQQQFGCSERMFGAQEVSGIKVAVVTVADGQPMLLTNFRRVEERTGDGGFYRIHQCQEPELEVLTWQCARATAAVPGLFSHIDLVGVGCCEDGGLKHNNPGLICRSETRFMWPSASEPATLVSLGTGSQHKKYSLSSDNKRHERSFPFRLYDSAMDTMDAEEGWKRLLGGLQDGAKQRYHRLNIDFSGRLPRLNSTGELSQMNTLVDKVARAQVIPALTSLLLASLFFELSSAPRMEHGQLFCIGAIRCRFQGRTLVEVLRRLYPAASTYLFGSETLDTSPYDDAVCSTCSRYCVPIRLRVKSMDSRIGLTLQLDDNLVKAVGAVAHSLRRFIEQQGFYLLGNSRSNGVPARLECQACDTKIHRKTTLMRPADGHRKRVHLI